MCSTKEEMVVQKSDDNNKIKAHLLEEIPFPKSVGVYCIKIM